MLRLGSTRAETRQTRQKYLFSHFFAFFSGQAKDICPVHPDFSRLASISQSDRYFCLPSLSQANIFPKIAICFCPVSIAQLTPSFQLPNLNQIEISVCPVFCILLWLGKHYLPITPRFQQSSLNQPVRQIFLFSQSELGKHIS